MTNTKIYRALAVALTLVLFIATLPATAVLAAADLRLTPAKDKVGNNIEAWGSGFGSGIVLKFYFSDQRIAVGGLINTDLSNYDFLGQRATSSTGVFEAFYFFVPSRLRDGREIKNVSGGSYFVYAADFYNVILARADFTVEATTEITLDPIEGTVGSRVKVSGVGFAANSNVSIRFDTTQVSTTTTNSNGSFTEATFTVPESRRGSHTVEAIDQSNNTDAATFTTKQSITITPTSAAAGDIITVIGTGFSNEVAVIITFDNTIASNNTTDTKGSFQIRFAALSRSAGSYEVKVEDGNGNAAKGPFTITTVTLGLSPTSGYAGSEITINGSGFQASKSVTITFDNETVKTTTTDNKGNFSATFTAPVRVAGSYKVKTSDGVNAGESNFSILTSAGISPVTSTTSPGYVGAELTISGLGFVASSALTITYDGNQVATAAVSADGSFTTTFKAPASKGGGHSIMATDGTITKSFIFVMESTPPPAPVPLKPETGIKAEAETFFDWEEVTDPSGFTYTLQVATEDDFSPVSIVLEKTGLTRSEYTITEEKRLKSVSKKSPYYWRVKAVDGASNESQWSGSGSFRVGGFSLAAPQSWLYILLGIGILLLIILGFWLGRKTAYY